MIITHASKKLGEMVEKFVIHLIVEKLSKLLSPRRKIESHRRVYKEIIVSQFFSEIQHGITRQIVAEIRLRNLDQMVIETRRSDGFVPMIGGIFDQS